MNSAFISFLLVVVLFSLTCSQRQVTFTCDGEHEQQVKGEPGAPGKRGPEGPVGNPGPIGPKGNAADVTVLQNDVITIEEMVTTMQQQLREMQEILNKIPKIYHYHLPSQLVTWTRIDQTCRDWNMTLCSVDRIIHRGIAYSVGQHAGDHWVPISDTDRDWLQIGTAHRFGQTHVAQFGSVPTWGETLESGSYKGHIFCCI